jgi:hypothetical protein
VVLKNACDHDDMVPYAKSSRDIDAMDGTSRYTKR